MALTPAALMGPGWPVPPRGIRRPSQLDRKLAGTGTLWRAKPGLQAPPLPKPRAPEFLFICTLEYFLGYPLRNVEPRSASEPQLGDTRYGRS